MKHRTLIAASELAPDIGNSHGVIVDCRFDLLNPEAGFAQYRQSHLPGAVYAHLNRDLSSPVSADSGRHPLPDPDAFKAAMGRFGVDSSKQVVAYDDAGGMLASRLWWLLRYYGHKAVAVLDGGLAKWQNEGRPVEAGVHQNAPAQFNGKPQQGWVVGLDEVEKNVKEARFQLIDSRSPERFRGELETIDPVAGHLPGAANHFYGNNLDSQGAMRPLEALRQQFETLFQGKRPEENVFYCGSGVSACHNLLALEHAGLSGARLYAGSWSQWCSDPGRPIAKGSD
ncbi:MAG: sulfurtransferase [Chloroflexi bacterium]|nr:sulfurtransferase [Chloroflexota bacterium]